MNFESLISFIHMLDRAKSDIRFVVQIEADAGRSEAELRTKNFSSSALHVRFVHVIDRLVTALLA